MITIFHVKFQGFLKYIYQSYVIPKYFSKAQFLPFFCDPITFSKEKKKINLSDIGKNVFETLQIKLKAY